MKEVVIVSACRTAIGKFGGGFKNTPAVELGAVVIKEALKRAGIEGKDVDEVVMGNVLQAAQGQNPARQAMIKAGMPIEVPALTVNKVCGSGLRCVSLAAQMIKAGDADVIVAGGMENMSMAPFAVPKARYGYRMGNGVLVDTMRSIWSTFMPVFFMTLRTAGTGPVPMIAGSTPAEAQSMMRASGLRPSSLAFSADITTTAAAPSLMPEALPAVTVPFLMKAGRSLAKVSMVQFGRMNSSLSTMTSPFLL